VARPASGAGRQTHELEPHAGFAFTSAQIEVRADVPAGAGLWSALWLLSTMPRPRPEIDVMEILGKDPNRLFLHVHYELDRDRQSPGKKVGVADLSDGWHTFSLTWSAHELIGGSRRPDPVATCRTPRRPAEAGVPHRQPRRRRRTPGPTGRRHEFPADMLIDSDRIWLPPAECAP
jgi:hypothetical protein